MVFERFRNKKKEEQLEAPEAWKDQPLAYEVVHGVPREALDGGEVEPIRFAVAAASKGAYDTLYKAMRETGEPTPPEGVTYDGGEEDGATTRVMTHERRDGSSRKLVGIEGPEYRNPDDSADMPANRDVVAFRDEVHNPDGSVVIHAWDVGGTKVQKVETPSGGEPVVTELTPEQVDDYRKSDLRIDF